MKFHTLIGTICIPFCATAAELPPLQCSGSMPDWTLSLTEDAATFDFQRSSEMSIPQKSTAEGRDWPYALTLVSRNDTAIVIIDRRECKDSEFAANVLTQRGQTPILLTGCCMAVE